jgi:glutamine amidotransferase
MTVIVDYGMGNVGSVLNMYRKVGGRAVLSSDPDTIAGADKLILPGVGAFDAAMERIGTMALRPALDHAALERKIPVLGICLGMQLLMDASEEGQLPGLGWIAGSVSAFKGRIDPTLKVPHMGWNTVTVEHTHAMTDTLGDPPRYYFVHSYFVKAADRGHCMLECDYGLPFDAGVCSGNIFGVQFHPEKSHRFGMQILHNFIRL